MGSAFRARHEGQEKTPEGPLILQRGGSGGDRRMDQRFWVWPLPPAGRLTLACEWPAYDIPLTTVDIEADPIIEAGGRSELVWEDGDDQPSGGGWTSAGIVPHS